MSTVRCYNGILQTNVAKCLLSCYDTIKAKNWPWRLLSRVKTSAYVARKLPCQNLCQRILRKQVNLGAIIT